jgi:hypothetical protein
MEGWWVTPIEAATTKLGGFNRLPGCFEVIVQGESNFTGKGSFVRLRPPPPTPQQPHV